jgi:glycosyltransferase involved in cell wall biosynthesis
MLGVSVAPFVRNSGYGHQAGIVFPQFKELGWNPMVYAYRGLIGASIMWPGPDGVQIQPQGRRSAFGWEMIPYYHRMHEADCVFSLANLFIFDEVKNLIARDYGKTWFHWTPIDCDPIGAPDYNILNLTGITPIAMSEFGVQKLQEFGWEDPIYVPHSIDCSVFRPPASQAAKAEAKALMGVRPEVFVIGMNAANEAAHDRKAFNEQLTAFAAFHSRHPQTLLYMHTIANRHPTGLDLESMIRRLGIDDAVVFCDPDLYSSGGYTPEMLREQFYWICDLGTTASKGEGFGLPLVEFQACGVPVVTSNFGPMKELSAPGTDGAYRVPGQKAWSVLDSSYWQVPIIDDLESAYEQFHLQWRENDIMGCQQAARVHALNWDTDRVRKEFWVPALERMGDLL